MYFDIRPKENKEEFFNYNYEYNLIKRALEREVPITFILGVRRVGKTSLMSVLFHELKGLKVWIDGRILKDPKRDIFNILNKSLNSDQPAIFGNINSLNFNFAGLGLEFNMDKSSMDIERRISKYKGTIYVFIDEAQRSSKDLSDVLSYFYDRHRNVRFILSGSEVGLLREIIGVNDPEHPLFGRYILEVKMNRLDRDRAFDFLKLGFEQVGEEISVDEIFKVLDELDGLIGWLTLYGYERAILKNSDALLKTKNLAKEIVAQELEHFLKNKHTKQLYIEILRNANSVGWSNLYDRVNQRLKRYVNESSFSSALENLLKYSFLEKRMNKYVIADPLIIDALHTSRFR